MSEILDSGERRKFESGAVRDIVDGKGRCDLLPLEEVAELFCEFCSPVYAILSDIADFVSSGDTDSVYSAIAEFAKHEYDEHEGVFTAVLEVAVHYEQGCNKYGERNWEKGIPAHCYVDSGVRHLIKYYRGDRDEPHDRAFIWNMLGLVWTVRNKPDLVDLPYKNL